MYKERKKKKLQASPRCVKMLQGGKQGRLETPSGEIHSHHSHQHYRRRCYHFATPTCLRAVTLCWIQSSSHVKQPHLRSVYACRHLQTRGSFRELRRSRCTATT